MESVDRVLADFRSQSSKLSHVDAVTNTLHIELLREHQGCAHWFEFSLLLDRPVPAIDVCIDNAGDSLYKNGWHGYRPFIFRDNEWVRSDGGSSYSGGVFRFRIENPEICVRAAWYEPYGVGRMIDFIQSRFTKCPVAVVDHEDNGFTIVRIGDEQLPQITVLARQHPGETIGNFFLEGFAEALLNDETRLAELLSHVSIVVVPIVNIEGVRQHRHRYDAQNRDYNRSWAVQHPPTEIAIVKELMNHASGHVLFVDVHGDEVSKVNYVTYRLGEKPLAIHTMLIDLIRKEQTNTFAWKPQPYWKRLAKNIVRRRRLVLPGGYTGNKYAAKTAHCLSLTYELSASTLIPTQAREEGRRFARSLHKSFTAARPIGGHGE